jgi:hypothetical protein
MKRARPDRLFHDYLDGRLTDEERTAFERTCERDEELARRLEAYREVRNALRSSESEPGQDFYAKARDRFSAAPPARRAWWPGLLSWEAAGLTAAVVLAAVLFVPAMTDLREPTRDSIRPDAEPEFLMEATPRRVPKGGEPVTAREKKGARADHRILALLGPVVEPGAVSTIENRQAWDDRFNARGSETLPRGAAYRPGERWVVVGPRGGPISCATIVVVAGPVSREIRIPATTGSPDRWGCVVIVPDDGREIRVTDSAGANDGR